MCSLKLLHYMKLHLCSKENHKRGIRTGNDTELNKTDYYLPCHEKYTRLKCNIYDLNSCHTKQHRILLAYISKAHAAAEP